MAVEDFVGKSDSEININKNETLDAVKNIPNRETKNKIDFPTDNTDPKEFIRKLKLALNTTNGDCSKHKINTESKINNYSYSNYFGIF